jgi:hypothetical protein
MRCESVLREQAALQVVKHREDGTPVVRTRPVLVVLHEDLIQVGRRVQVRSGHRLRTSWVVACALITVGPSSLHLGQIAEG